MDHIVLSCADVERTLAWYTDVLGLATVRLDQWRRGEAPFPSVRINAGTIIDLVPGDTTDGRLDHFCVVIEPTDLDAVAASGRFEVVEGPAKRYGARGDGTSLYVRDPDGAIIELRYYLTNTTPAGCYSVGNDWPAAIAASIAAGARICSSTITAAPAMPASSPSSLVVKRNRTVASGNDRL